MYNINPLKEAVRKKNWTLLKKTMQLASPGEALFILTHMLDLPEAELRRVKEKYLSEWCARNAGLIADWKAYMQGPSWKVFGSALLATESMYKLSRAIFLRNINGQKPAIREWIRYELREFKATRIRTLADEIL